MLAERTQGGRVIGDSEELVAIVEAVKPAGAGKSVVSFREVKYPWRQLSCYDTNQIDRIDYTSSSALVIYKKQCEGVGPVQMRKHRDPPVTLTEADAARIKPGMRAIFVESGDGQDVAIEKLFWPKPKKGQKPDVIIDGIVIGTDP